MNNFKRFLKENRKHSPGLILILLLALLAGFFKTSSARYWGSAVDYGLSGQFHLVQTSILLMLLFIVLDGIRTAVLYKVNGLVTEKIFKDLRMRMYNVLVRGDVSSIEKSTTSGDIVSRINNDVSTFSQLLAGSLPDMIRRNFMAVMAIAVGFFTSWQLLAVYIVMIPLSLFILNKLSKVIQTQTKKSAVSMGGASTLASDALYGIQTIKSFNLEETMNRKFEGIGADIFKQNMKSEKSVLKMSVIRQISSVLQTILIFSLGIYFVYRGILSPGAVLTFTAISGYISDAFNQSERTFSLFRSLFALADRMYEILDIPIEENGACKGIDPGSELLIEARDLSFSYGDAKVLDRVNIRVEKGKKVAVIGSSGSGKSTFVKLVCGFYKPAVGDLKVFSQDILHLDLQRLREEISLISQNPGLFGGTVYENVQFGNIDASGPEVLGAISHAAIDLTFLSRKEDTQVGEFGQNLSGGQKQRVAIARAFLKHAPLLILDEATSALDMKTESEIQQTLETIFDGQTAMIVAHRIATIKMADYIYCLDQGKIIEEGTPADLYRKKGYFHRMCAAQQVTIGEGENEG